MTGPGSVVSGATFHKTPTKAKSSESQHKSPYLFRPLSFYQEDSISQKCLLYFPLFLIEVTCSC